MIEENLTNRSRGSDQNDAALEVKQDADPTIEEKENVNFLMKTALAKVSKD